MGRWNGSTQKTLTLFQSGRRVLGIPIGSEDYLLQLLARHRISPEIYRNQISHPVNIRFVGTLKKFQIEALEELLSYRNGTIAAPTGSGKTVMGIFALCYRKEKTLILVHTKDLALQWIERLQQFTNLSPQEIGLLGGGKKKHGRRVTVGLIQTVSKMVEDIDKDYGMVIADECHRSPSKMFTSILANINVSHRLGLTATPYRRDGLNRLIEWFCGEIRTTIDKSRLVESGDVLQPLFVMKGTNYTTNLNPIHEYSTMLSELTQNESRNKLIVDLIDDIEKSDTLCLVVLSDRKEHCFTLDRMLKEKGVDPLVMTGDSLPHERVKIIDSMNNGAKILIATGQLIGEGFDCKNLNTLILASPIRFSGRIIQYAGRIMRPAKGKQRPVVYDFVDWRVPVLARSGRSRVRVYGKENTEIE